jgi:hypothetical protein
MVNFVTTKSFRLRTAGPQRIESGFLMQTFGVERNITNNFCSTVDLAGSENMQAFKEIAGSGFAETGPADVSTLLGSSGGPFRSVSYQARRIILGDTGELVFNGTEDFVATYCEDEVDAVGADETSCISCVL